MQDELVRQLRELRLALAQEIARAERAQQRAADLCDSIGAKRQRAGRRASNRRATQSRERVSQAVSVESDEYRTRTPGGVPCARGRHPEVAQLCLLMQHTLAHALIKNLGERSGFGEDT